MDTKILKKLARFCILSIALLGLTLHVSAEPIALLSPTNFWKYNDESIDLGTGWIATNYNDSAWSNGLSALGFRSLGNTNYQLPPPNFIHTLLRKTTPTNAARNIMTFYFRTHLTFTNDPGGMTLTASNLIDDGAIFYINGRELERVAMPEGPVTWDTTATRGDLIGTNRTPTLGTHGYDVFSVPIDALVQGDNVVAVEVHQASTSSSAMAFQMELWADFPAPTFLTITNDLTDIIVEEGRPVTLRIGISGDGGHFQWYRQGTGPIVGAFADRYSIPSSGLTNSGFYYVVVTNTVNSVTSRVMQLTVTADTNGPVLVDADGSLSTTNVLVTFSEPILPSTATNLTNYKITNTLGGTQTVIRAVLTSPTNVLLTATNARISNNNYLLIVNGVRDSSPRTNLIVANSRFPISNLATNIIGLGSGGWRFYDPYPPFDAPNLGTTWKDVSYVETNAWTDGASVFWNATSPVIPGPAGTQLSQTPTFTSYFRYNLSGYEFSAGPQKFFLTHVIDDGAVIYLNGTEIFRTNLPGGTVSYTTPASATVGNPSRVGPVALTNTFLSGANVIAAELHQIASVDSDKYFGIQIDANVRSVPVGPVIITGGPGDITAVEGQSATFNVVQVGGSSFQWQQNNVNVGGNSASYTVPLVTAAMNNAQFHVTVSGTGGSVTSTNARLRVLSDTNGPVLLSAYAKANSVLVNFSENVAAASGTALANYLVTNSAGQSFAATGASITNGSSVLLSFSSLPANTYFVVVNNVRDASAAGNLIAPNSAVKTGFNTDVISYASTWRYDQRAIDLSAQGWTARTYNDGAWSGSGAGLFDGKAGGRTASTLPLPVGTVLLAPTNGPAGAYIYTTYYRTHFDSYAAGQATITFSTVVDDGAVLYLNGVEMTNRIRMSSSTPAFTTQATSSVGDANVEGPFTLTVTNLLLGDNVIAVEVHQSGTTSSDVTWGGSFSVFVPSSVVPTNQVPTCTPIAFNLPSLIVQRVSGTNLLMSWTNPVTNSCGSNAVFTLQQTLAFTNPVSSTVWSEVTTVSPYMAIGTNQSRFFRLKR